MTPCLFTKTKLQASDDSSWRKDFLHSGFFSRGSGNTAAAATGSSTNSSAGKPRSGSIETLASQVSSSSGTVLDSQQQQTSGASASSAATQSQSVGTWTLIKGRVSQVRLPDKKHNKTSINLSSYQ